ncbi:hypothetical protein N658DRAFT_488559 [Parathielavia hyrcaniae]|uniref:Uncharacterized protein n=1 Tax=Parathielavia hyrcaniae TaxID=113614 RepID=A0AAN6PUS3_9PEZI|nr:hypothetical protein N658DRAFT_488559 [Parathielavia hyrcaniae]
MFDRLPRPIALLLLASFLELTDAHAIQQLPRKTPSPTLTIPHRVLNVASWPIRPTPPPGADLFAFRRRQLDEYNTVCGYIGGDSALPATCGSGSHCVVDTEHNVVGCCPDGAASCTDGVFTGCVDGNSGPQTEVNPYIFSCTGGNVCYMNVYDGGYSQFGCGTASDLAATVKNSASGATVLTRPTVSVSYTQGVSTLSTPITLVAPTSGSSTSSSASSSSSATSSASSSSSDSSSATSGASSSTTSSSTATADPSSTTSASAPAGAATDDGYRTGVIVGGTIGGVAVLIAVIGLAFIFLRRRNANVRQGPGLGGVRGKVISPPKPGGGTGFHALAHDDGDAFETGPGGSVFNQPPTQPPPQQMQMAAIHTAAAAESGAAVAAAAHRSMLPPIATGPPMPFQSGRESEISPVDYHFQPDSGTSARSPYAAAGAASVSSYPPSSSGGISGVTDNGYNNNNNNNNAAPAGAYHYPGQYPAAYAGGTGLMMGTGMTPLLVNRGAERQLESDQVPLTATRELDDFSQGFHAALGRIGEEDEEEAEEEDNREREREGGRYRDAPPGQQQHEAGLQGVAGEEGAGTGTGTHDSAGSGAGRPLWQQNRRQSRNLMWM